jgi:hypothetical protein
MLGRWALILLPRLQEIGPQVDQPRLVETGSPKDGMTEGAIHMPDGVDLPMRAWESWDRPAEAVILALLAKRHRSWGNRAGC